MEKLTWDDKDLSILIIGYDGYKDVWDIDIKLLNKYWSNRPKTPIYNMVTTNNKNIKK